MISLQHHQQHSCSLKQLDQKGGGKKLKKLRHVCDTQVQVTVNEKLAKHMCQPGRSLQPPKFSGAFSQTASGLPALTLRGEKEEEKIHRAIRENNQMHVSLNSGPFLYPVGQ